MIVNNLFYQEVGRALVNKNTGKCHKYIMTQKVDITNPLACVDPLYKDFYGPRVLNLVVLSKNYGWSGGVLSWPEPEISSTLLRIKDSFANWTEFKTLIWVDMVLSNRIMAATPTSAYRTQMDQVATNIENICMEMGDYGFTYKGLLETGVDESYFQTFVDDFWKD
jgi:hypothetical protein